MTPLEVLSEHSRSEPDRPARLRELDGGGFETRVFANFVEMIDGMVAIPALPRSNAPAPGESEAGHAHRVDEPAEREQLAQLGINPWAGGKSEALIRIETVEISGRDIETE